MAVHEIVEKSEGIYLPPPARHASECVLHSTVTISLPPLPSACSSSSSSSSSSTLQLTTMRLFLFLLLSAVQIGAARGAAKAPAAASAASNLTDLMSRKGCRNFAELLLSTADAAETFQDSVAGGLSVFCPTDQAVKGFLPTFKNLSADSKLSLLLYHAVPVYYSAQSLKSNNGVMNTLATDGTAKNYNFTVQNDGEQVTIQPTASPGAPVRITATILDRDPLAVYAVDEVLQPRELFKPAAAPTPAPAPAAAAPKKAKHGGKHESPPAPVPAGPNEAPADQKVADQNAALRVPAGRWLPAAAAALAVAVAAAAA